MKCTYCDHEAKMRCRAHRRYLCMGENCAALHRLSIRPDRCEMFEPRRTDWTGLLLTIGGISVAVVATAIAFAHLWRIQ